MVANLSAEDRARTDRILSFLTDPDLIALTPSAEHPREAPIGDDVRLVYPVYIRAREWRRHPAAMAILEGIFTQGLAPWVVSPVASLSDTFRVLRQILTCIQDVYAHGAFMDDALHRDTMIQTMSDALVHTLIIGRFNRRALLELPFSLTGHGENSPEVILRLLIQLDYSIRENGHGESGENEATHVQAQGPVSEPETTENNASSQ